LEEDLAPDVIFILVYACRWRVWGRSKLSWVGRALSDRGSILNEQSGDNAQVFDQTLYLQVRDVLAGRISTSQWKPKAAIPNEGDLARAFGVSSGTMRKALDLLETERLLTRRQGRGTFVNDQAAGELGVRYSNIRVGDGEHVGGEVQLLDVVKDAPNQTECARLRVRMHEQV
jgi:DNA-binding GntR family transcriptional regulator